MFILLQVGGVSTPPNEFNDFLLWVIGLLVTVIIAMWGLYIKTNKTVAMAYDLRMKDKDIQISKLEAERLKLQEDNKKFFQEMKPAMEAQYNLAKNILDLITHGRK